MPWAQEWLCEAARRALAAVAADVRQGLLETVELESEWVEGERASVLCVSRRERRRRGGARRRSGERRVVA